MYAGIVALGFAATENTLYIYRDGYLENGFAGLFSLAFIRVVLVGWQHPFYTAFIGIGLAITRLTRNPAVRLAALLTGLSLAIFLHSFHNTAGKPGQGLWRFRHGDGDRLERVDFHAAASSCGRSTASSSGSCRTCGKKYPWDR